MRLNLLALSLSCPSAPLTLPPALALVESLDAKIICSGRGSLVNGRCRCERGWASEDCSVDACEHMLCTGHATCHIGICRCDIGWLPPACDIDTCPGHFPAGASRGCGALLGRGLCVSGQCVCTQGWSGAACDIDTCPAHCSGHGTCLGGVCNCDRGWGDTNCSAPSCPMGCSGNGNCTRGGVCTCDRGWTGAACDVKRCPYDCYGHGACVDGRCECELGWRVSPHCASDVCPSGVAGASCSGHGTCMLDATNSSSGTCVCHGGWAGAACTETPPPSPPIASNARVIGRL